MKRRTTVAERDRRAIAAPEPASQQVPEETPEPGRGEPRPASARSEVTRVGVYLTPETFDAAKSAYLCDWRNGGTADRFPLWIAQAIEEHAARTPDARASQARGRSASRTGISRSFKVPTVSVNRMREAIVEDNAADRWPTDSTWINAAIERAIEAARDRNGGTLPPAPARLPNKLTR